MAFISRGINHANKFQGNSGTVHMATWKCPRFAGTITLLNRNRPRFPGIVGIVSMVPSKLDIYPCKQFYIKSYLSVIKLTPGRVIKPVDEFQTPSIILINTIAGHSQTNLELYYVIQGSEKCCFRGNRNSLGGSIHTTGKRISVGGSIHTSGKRIILQSVQELSGRRENVYKLNNCG